MALGATAPRRGPVAASLLVVALGSYERLFWLLTAALAVVSIGVFAAGTEISREPAPSVTADAASDRSA